MSAAQKAFEAFTETPEAAVVVDEPVVVVNQYFKSGRVKGTWTMTFGEASYDFVDGQRYSLPLPLYEYLKNSGNIYDTL